MRSIRKNSLFVSALVFLTPAAALAAGLGKLSVLSGLGEPLKAEVEVVAVQPNEADSLNARVASPDAFRQAGIDYSGVMTQVRANVSKRDGKYVVTLVTLQPVEEPYLDVLLELNSPSGRLLRQYTFLLDPVGYKVPEPAVVPPVVTAPQTETKVEAKPLPAPETATAPAPKTAKPAAPAKTAKAPAAKTEQQAKAEPKPAPKAEAKTEAKAEAKPEATPAGKTPEGSYQVQDGDTLGEIAAAHKPDYITLEQMMVAIQRANEDAFINKNINLVKSGRILRIPENAEVAKVMQDEAAKIVDTQAKEFNEYRNKLAQQVAAAPAPTGEKTEQKSSGKIVTKAPEKAPAEAPKDQVRLSRPDDAKGSGAGKGPSADDIAAREKALKEAQQRVAELERNVKDLQTVVELKNKQLAELQQQTQAQAAAADAAKKAEAAKTPEPAQPEAQKPATAPAEAEKLPELPKAAEPAPESAKAPETPVAPTPDAVTPPAPPAEEPVQPAPPPVAEKPATPKAPPAPPPAPEPTVFDLLTENWPILAGAVAVLLLLGLLWRRKQSAGLNNSLIGATTTDSSSVFGTTGGRSVDTGSHSMQTDFSQSALGSIDTDEVDPIAEADVYMAYGRDAQAEEILKEALQKDPSRQAVRLKLLEIYAGRKDLKAFETTAGEIYSVTGGSGPEWNKAAELGRGIDPSNPMYGSGGDTAPGRMAPAAAAAPVFAEAPTTVAPPPKTDLSQPLFDLDLGKGGNAQTAPDLALEHAPQPGDVALDIDLNLNTDMGADTARGEPEKADFSPSGTFIMDDSVKKAVSQMVAQSPAPAAAPDLNIDFELPDSGAPATTPLNARTLAPAPASNVIDLDFKVDEVRDVPAVDLASVNLDLNEDSDSHWQEVATKLDLAKAYEEMGDKDGARELLNEVLKEGDNAQQDQARTMLGAMR